LPYKALHVFYKKCGAADCTICKLPCLSRELFDTIAHLPDPVKDGEVYKSFSDVLGTITTEKDRPSLQSSAEKNDSGVPFNHSGQFVQNVGKFVECTECNTVLYSSHKLLWKDQKDLDYVLSGISFSCGTTLKDYITNEVGNEHTYILDRVFVRKNVSCNSRIETPYYSYF